MTPGWPQRCHAPPCSKKLLGSHWQKQAFKLLYHFAGVGFINVYTGGIALLIPCKNIAGETLFRIY